jgi:hypothetical protein
MVEIADKTAEEVMPYRMTLSLNVLNHLGINLYSNVPAVLAEVVANAWDADAESVRVQIDVQGERITITDDGHGMSRDDVNAKFLMVGYRRRDSDAERITPKFHRPVMGRKGIGKLSLFSIANRIDVYSIKDKSRSGFRMDVTEIKDKISESVTSYFPKALNDFPSDLSVGTRIVLSELKKTIWQAETALRKRLARRFSVIGESHHFSIVVNGTPIAVTDRDYFHKVQFIWTYDQLGTEIAAQCPNVENIQKRDPALSDSGFKISGWIGTARESGDLKDGADNLNKILIMVRGKLAQEDVLDSFTEGGIYSKYLIGEIHADFLDTDDREDIATSGRQRIIEDDPRYLSLLHFLRGELKNIQNQWTTLRNAKGEKVALEIPAVKEWFASLGAENKSRARSLFGKINQLTLTNEADRKRLLKHSILAFESLRYRDNLQALDAVAPENLDAFTMIFEDLDDIEATLYHQIVSERLQVIQALETKVEANEREKIIQKHLFEHLWLLDPSWERVTGSEYMEKQASKEFGDIDAKLTTKEMEGRIDLKYRVTSGKHLIIELKRADRILTTAEVLEQGSKYRSALRKLLNSTGQKRAPIEVVCVVGRPLQDWEDEENGRDESARALEEKGIRVVMYQELIENAHRAYKAYLEKKQEAGRILKVIQSIEDQESF